MTTLVEKIEALAAATGKDVEKVWDEFVAFVEGNKEAVPAEAAAPVDAPVEVPAEAPVEPAATETPPAA